MLWEPNRQGHFYKANSLDQILRRVRQVLLWSFASGQLASDPTRELILHRPVQPVAEKLSWDELELLFQVPDRSTAVGLRDAVMFRLVAETELGVSGCLELRLGHESLLSLEQETRALLATYLERGRPVLATRPEEVALFLGRAGRPLGAQAVFVRIQDAAKRAGPRQLVGGTDSTQKLSGPLGPPGCGQAGGQAGILTVATKLKPMEQKVNVLRQDAHGIWRVSGTRVSLDSLVYAFWDGSSPEGIAEQFDSVPLGDIYLALGYYLTNRDEVDAYLQEQRRLDDEAREYWEKKQPAQGLRAKLLARQAASA